MKDLRDSLISLGLQLPENFSLDDWAARLAELPCRNTAALVAAGAVLFYAAEKNSNPKVNDVWDAGIYASTCLSVGYGDIFAKTPLGKIIGTTLMTIGPAISGRALDGPAKPDPTQEEILMTLRRILTKLEASSPRD